MGVGSGRRPLCLPPQLVKRAKILFRQPHLGALRRPADVASQAALQIIIDFRERRLHSKQTVLSSDIRSAKLLREFIDHAHPRSGVALA